ncbi:helix-turn-helix transcriptional regulator [Pseudidiomarina marina]|uniref:HTH cro/C1-type domain-containing protein n=1 Tax=Pseudidiomarina marina TaxID=502366 RepID=A0A432YCE7_9GAMM|nr:helix-turn-helix transcriptional regulator [Pseudidiomarina marina]RUO58670.1 hypothetical protein CWI76_11135 [Pseudidiomarina marina]
MSNEQIHKLLKEFRRLRLERGITAEQLESRLILGTGWIEDIEEGNVSITLEMFFALLKETGITLNDISSAVLDNTNEIEVPRAIRAEQHGKNLKVLFKYAKFDSQYLLHNASLEQFNQVLKCLRDGLSRLVTADEQKKEAIKTESVASAFKLAVTLWPKANPSDLWWFVVYRAYLDQFNHPSIYSRMSFEQSWKRTGGWALEEVLVRHYGPALREVGINLFIASKDQRIRLLSQANISERLEADKADVLLTGIIDGVEIFFGIVHVKASFAERRTDDVPMSKALVDAGYVSPLWTMDCKSSPSVNPNNKGELGAVKTKTLDVRSAKRKDIEDDGYFSACFSYNTNTIATPESQDAAARIFVCNFASPDADDFFNYINERWQIFKKDLKATQK